jgi:hypothetical protein
MLLATVGGWTAREIVKAIIITIGLCAIIFVIAKACEITIPRWFIALVAIVAVCFFGIIAADFLFAL